MEHPPTPRLTRSLLKLLLPADVRDEILADLAHRFRRKMAEGSSPGEARSWYRRQALRALGPALRARLPGDEGGGAPSPAGFGPATGGPREGGVSGKGAFLDGLTRDLLFALVQLRRHPGFSILVLLTLALGVGATTSVFTLVDAALFRPLPYQGSERMVVIRGDEYIGDLIITDFFKTNGLNRFVYRGIAGALYQVQLSTNGLTWTNAPNGTNFIQQSQFTRPIGGDGEWEDFDPSTNHKVRLYRILRQIP